MSKGAAFYEVGTFNACFRIGVCVDVAELESCCLRG